MISTLRKIRSGLLEEKKIKSYLIYGIGEITLVVVGILIAVNINNLNEKFQNSKIEKEILYQLQEEYTFNLIQLEQKISMRNEIINASLDVMKYMDNPDIDLHKDTLNAKIRFLNIDPTFDPIQNNLIGSGNIRLIKNKELKKKLINWSSNFKAVQEMELQWQKTTIDFNTPYQIKLGILRDMEHVNYSKDETPDFIIGETQGQKIDLGRSRFSPSVKSLLSDPYLEGLMTVAVRTNNTANLQSFVLRDEIKEILELVENELK